MKRTLAVSPAWAVSMGLGLVLLMPPVAAQAWAPPPTLTGESLHSDSPTTTSVTCFPDQPPHMTGGGFTADGTATGPYPGTFHETASFTITYDPTTSEPVSRDFTASVTIESSIGTVTGTKHSNNFGSGCGPVDDPNANDLEINTGVTGGFAPTDTYNAQIVTPAGETYTDNGLFQLAFVSDQSTFDESFASSLTSPQPSATPPSHRPHHKHRRHHKRH